MQVTHTACMKMRGVIPVCRNSMGTLVSMWGPIRISSPIPRHITRQLHLSALLLQKSPQNGNGDMVGPSSDQESQILDELQHATHLEDIPNTKVHMKLKDLPHPHLFQHTAQPPPKDGMPPHPAESPVAKAAHTFGRYVTETELSLMRAMYIKDRSSFRQLLLAVGIAVAAGLFISWPYLKKLFITETSDVATQLLSARDVQEKASIFAKAVLNETLSDQDISREANRFVQQLLQAPETRAMALQLVADTLNDPETLRQTQALLNALLSGLMQNPVMQQQLLELVLWLVAQPYTQTALVDLLNRTCLDPTFQSYGAVLLTDLFTRTFADEPLKGKAIAWLMDILGSEELRQQGGNYLYAAYKSSITPSFMKPSTKHHIVDKSHHTSSHPVRVEMSTTPSMPTTVSGATPPPLQTPTDAPLVIGTGVPQVAAINDAGATTPASPVEGESATNNSPIAVEDKQVDSSEATIAAPAASLKNDSKEPVVPSAASSPSISSAEEKNPNIPQNALPINETSANAAPTTQAEQENGVIAEGGDRADSRSPIISRYADIMQAFDINIDDEPTHVKAVYKTATHPDRHVEKRA